MNDEGFAWALTQLVRGQRVGLYVYTWVRECLREYVNAFNGWGLAVCVVNVTEDFGMFSAYVRFEAWLASGSEFPLFIRSSSAANRHSGIPILARVFIVDVDKDRHTWLAVL